MRSMTGYGRAQVVQEGMAVTVEMRSVNHRYLEFTARVPRNYGFLEDRLKGLIQQGAARGKVDVFVTIDNAEEAGTEVLLNRPLAKGYFSALQELGKCCGLEDSVTLSDLARLNDIFTVCKAEMDEELIWSRVQKAAAEALEAFLAMRSLEGEALKRDVAQRLDTLSDLVQFIEERGPQLTAEYQQRLQSRVQELLGDRQVEEQRLLTEVALFADKTAVAEETVRLRSHLEQIHTLILQEGAVGRKLDFIIQEVNREINTIGSKIQDIEVTQRVVEMKSEVEKIREQIQNIE